MASKSYEKIADICDQLMLQVQISHSNRPLIQTQSDFHNSFSKQVAAEGVAFEDEWPYPIHLLGYLYVNDMYVFTLSQLLFRVLILFMLDYSFAITRIFFWGLIDPCSNSARFLWKSIPSAIKENNPQVVAAWKIGQRLWTRDYAGVYEDMRGFEWSQEVQPLVTALSGNVILSVWLFIWAMHWFS